MFFNLEKFYILIFVSFIILSCEDRLDKLKEDKQLLFLPTSFADQINTKYVDSGKLISLLKSPKMINFSNLDFPFYDFPYGIDLTLFDKKNDTINVISDLGMVFSETDIIDLRGNVVLITSTKDTLFTEQLYYDQKKEWLFTDFPVRFRTNNYITDGVGFDSNQAFTNAQVTMVTGRIFIEN